MNAQHALGASATWRRTAEPALQASVTLRGRGLLAARLIFLAFAALALWLDITNLWRLWQADSVSLLGPVVSFEQMRAALAGMWPAPGIYLAALITRIILSKVIFYFAAFLLVWKRSDQALALLVAAFLIASNAADYPPNLFALLATEPIRANLHLAISLVFQVLSLWLFFLFPDGHFTPRWTIPLAATWAVVIASDTYITRTIDHGPAVGAVIYLGAAVAAVGAQVYRYRRISGLVERQQTKWFLGGLGVWFLTFAVGNAYLGASGLLGNDVPVERAIIPWLIVSLASSLAELALAGSLAVGVLRYRLFAIDMIINRTLVYGGLTSGVVGVYVLIVGYLGAILHTGASLPISLVATGIVAVLFQPLRAWLQRGVNRLLYGERDEPYTVVARLGRRLEASLAPEVALPTIVETVAAALKLPYAAIVLPDEGGGTVAADYGTATSDARVVVPLVYQGETVGELRLVPRPGEHALSSADRRLVDDLARQAGIAVRTTQLTRDLQRARERLVTAREEERRRLRRDLHDGLGPALASQALTIDTAGLLLERDPSGAAALLRAAKDQSQAAVAEIRRVVYALRPPALDDLGLAGALREAAGRYAGTDLEVTVDAPEALPPLPAAVEVAAYRIVQEAVANVARHAHASRCSVALVPSDGALIVTIADDGVGIAPDRRAGVGLASMRERAEELGGVCTVEPNPGGGTRVAARLPL